MKVKRLNQELIKAVKQGELSQARELLKDGADANTKDSENAPILYFALLGGENNKMVELLLQNKADPNTWFEKHGCPILSLAITVCSLDLMATFDTLGLPTEHLYSSPQESVRILLQYGADPYIEDENGHNAFTVARAMGRSDLVDIMRVEIVKLEAEELRVVAQLSSAKPSQPRSRL